MHVILPKKIWILWLQGEADMPFVVRNCYSSWKKQNSAYEVTLLTENNISDFIDVDGRILNNPVITKQALSDIIRVLLLEKVGGVWVDATCFCTKPLDDWLPSAMTFDFYAFQKPGVDRLISSWFLASVPKGALISAYKKKVMDYWLKSDIEVQFGGSSGVTDANNKSMQRLRNTDAMSWAFINRFHIEAYIKKTSPYFWFHYLFALVLHSDVKVKEAWFKQNSLSADIPHFLIFKGLNKLVTDDLNQYIDSNSAPLYKLNWRVEEADLEYNCVLNYLFRTQSNEQ